MIECHSLEPQSPDDEQRHLNGHSISRALAPMPSRGDISILDEQEQERVRLCLRIEL